MSRDLHLGNTLLNWQVAQARLPEVLLRLELVLQQLGEVSHVLAGGRLREHIEVIIDMN